MFPFPPLLTATGITLGQIGGQQSDDAPGGVAELCRRFQVSKKIITRWRRDGLTEPEADRAAAVMGLHPADLWPTEWARLLELEILPPAAKSNTVKSCCPMGHPYTHMDSAGARRCRWCCTENVRRFRAKTQVGQTITPAAGAVEERQLELFAC